MGQVAVLGLALMVQVMAAAVLTLDSKEIKVITATRVVTISINSLLIKATQSFM